MKRLIIISVAMIATSSATFGQVISADRNFPPAGSKWMAPEAIRTESGITFESMEISDFVSPFSIPSNGLGGVLPPIRCVLKTRTKSNQTNERIGFTLSPTSITSDREEYDFTVELFPDLSISNPVQFQLSAGGRKTGHVSLIKQLTGDYVVSGTMGLDLDYSEDSGASWSRLTTTANFSLQAVPEPSSLCALGFAGLIALRRSKKKPL
jgi:hypothetical protein